MKFTYLEVSRGVFAPIINLEIWTGGRWVVCEAYILLGRVGFFDRFRICFDDKDRIVETTQL